MGKGNKSIRRKKVIHNTWSSSGHQVSVILGVYLSRFCFGGFFFFFFVFLFFFFFLIEMAIYHIINRIKGLSVCIPPMQTHTYYLVCLFLTIRNAIIKIMSIVQDGIVY